MQYVSEWATLDRKKLVVFSTPVLQVFAKYRQRYFWQHESGGILLGKRRGKHIEVLVATEPMPRDHGSHYFFDREADGHAELARLAWCAGYQMVDYVGEWHTHPQGVPIPSGLDRSEWDKLGAARSDLNALVTVVVGTRQLHVELIKATGESLLEAISPRTPLKRAFKSPIRGASRR